MEHIDRLIQNHDNDDHENFEQLWQHPQMNKSCSQYNKDWTNLSF